MINEIVRQQKAERDNFIKGSYIPREKLEFAGGFLSSKLIKVITGPRRAGKSVFAFLLLKDKKFAYLNFDDENLLKVKNYDEFVKSIFEVYGKVDFVFFDEIQNLENWEVFANKLQRRGINLILTGSNAKLLYKEMAARITGRHIPVEVLPFSFKEFLAGKNFGVNEDKLKLSDYRGKILNYAAQYLKDGGFPETVVGDISVSAYLETLFDAILFKDVVKRNKVRHPQKIYDLAVYTVSNFTCEFTFTRVKNILNFQSVTTAEKYMSYLEDAYLFFPLNRFSFKVKEQMNAPRKIYLADNGFVAAKAVRFSTDMGRLMENLVFIEILRRGYKLNTEFFYYKNGNGSEVDFLLKKGTQIEKLIQVCYSVENAYTRKREITSLVKASEKMNCEDLCVITWDEESREKIKGKEVVFVPLWKWLAG